LIATMIASAASSSAQTVRSIPSNRVYYSVIVPFFNEEANVAPLLAELRRVLDPLGRNYEVILVDDGSSDSTAAILKRVADTWPHCVVLPFRQNRGQAAALLSGFHRAAGSVFVTLDGDGQNDPADIPHLLARLDGADMVAGIRASREDSTLRRIMSRVANGVRGKFLGDGMTDTGCALKAFRREVAGSFIPIRTLYSFMPALAVAAGYRVVEQAVNHRPRLAGTSKYGLLAMAWRPLIDMIGIRWFASRRVAEARS
jgi:glycosyltransferase involved in cell wall biosynthesis